MSDHVAYVTGVEVGSTQSTFAMSSSASDGTMRRLPGVRNEYCRLSAFLVALAFRPVGCFGRETVVRAVHPICPENPSMIYKPSSRSPLSPCRVALLLTLVSAPFFVTSPDSSSSRLESLPVVAHWRFQDGIRDLTAVANIRDSGPHSRHGRLHGGPRYVATPLPVSNLGLLFDGQDDRIQVPDDPLFHLTGSITIEAYVRVDGFGNNLGKIRHIAFRGDDRAGLDPWFLCVTETGQLGFVVANALNKTSILLSPHPLPVGEFIHVAGRLDDETGEQSVFLNGKRVATTNSDVRACGRLGGSNPGVGVGGRCDESPQGFCGVIAEVRIVAAALGADMFLKAPSSMR